MKYVAENGMDDEAEDSQLLAASKKLARKKTVDLHASGYKLFPHCFGMEEYVEYWSVSNQKWAMCTVKDQNLRSYTVKLQFHRSSYERDFVQLQSLRVRLRLGERCEILADNIFEKAPQGMSPVQKKLFQDKERRAKLERMESMGVGSLGLGASAAAAMGREDTQEFGKSGPTPRIPDSSALLTTPNGKKLNKRLTRSFTRLETTEELGVGATPGAASGASGAEGLDNSVLWMGNCRVLKTVEKNHQIGYLVYTPDITTDESEPDYSFFKDD